MEIIEKKTNGDIRKEEKKNTTIILKVFNKINRKDKGTNVKT